MAENILETRIQLRYDSYSNWMNSRVILKPGEVAIARVDYSSSINPATGTYSNNYAIGIKVGDGQGYFYELPWVQAIASDVYNWAKASTKPTYNADEIEDLQTFIENHSGGSSGGTASTSYQIVRGTGNNINKYYLQRYDDDTNQWIVDTANYIDVDSFVKLVNWVGDDALDYFTLGARIFDTVSTELRKLNVSDEIENNKVVVAVNQTNGKISTVKQALNLNNFTGPLNVELGGTGLTSIEQNAILVGGVSNTFTTKIIETELDNSTNLATNLAIKRYIDNATAGLTGAMHYIGEATVEISTNGTSRVNPQISGYDFSKVQYGDVITFNQQEFVWAGSWHLLGDEGSYAIKGSIVNADISSDAQIDQSKIYNLTEDLASKVTAVDGKGLSSFDFTQEFRNKLLNIEDGAQVNAIEHIFVNDVERPIVTINGAEKSIALSIDVFDEDHATKLDNIEPYAQVNAIEHIFLNGVELVPTVVSNLNKSVNISFTPFTEAEKTKLTNIEAEAQVNLIERIALNGVEITPTNKLVDITMNVLTNAERQKLAEIEAGAQVNIIEHITVDGVEQTLGENKTIALTTDISHINKIEHILYNDVELLPDANKTVHLSLNPITAEERTKLSSIESGAQVNLIEHITVNGTEQTITNKTISLTIDPHTDHINKIEQIFINGREYVPDSTKAVRITLDQAALNLNVLEGAMVPQGAEWTVVPQIDKKLQLARIAMTGDVQDLLQEQNTYITLNCGSSTEVI